jgi:hypothetical protein
LEGASGPSGIRLIGPVALRLAAEEGTMDRPDVDRDSRIGRAQVAEGSQTNSKPVISRRTAIGGAIGGGLITLLARPELATAQESAALVLLLKGLYQPVVNGPDLGLSRVNLSDGSYSTTKIYPVSGVRGHRNVLEAIGDFYVQFEGNLCAYDLPGGAVAMRFTPRSNTELVPDGSGGSYLQGTFELRIPEATGRYRSFVGGHNRMVDNLHFLASGDVDEFCVCLISRRRSSDD